MKRENRNNVMMTLMKGRTLLVLLILVIFFGVKSPAFLTATSVITVMKHVALYGIIGIGMTYVIIIGGIDLSVGSIVGLTGMIAGGLIVDGLQIGDSVIYFNVVWIVIIALLIGAVVGAINGLVITRCGVAPFIATLGMMYVCRGLAMLRTNGATFQNLKGEEALGNTGFNSIGGSVGPIPVVVIVFIVLAVVAGLILKFSSFGVHTLAVGGNEKAAELSGIKTKKVMLIVYIMSGVCSAIVGLITTAQLTAANPSAGDGWEMNAISAVVLGGTSMTGGVGSVGGTIIGAFVIGVINDGMVMIGVSEFWQRVIKGIIIVLAVIIDQAQAKMSARMALQQASGK